MPTGRGGLGLYCQTAARKVRITQHDSELFCLIWSYEHQGWWLPARNGYTVDIDSAGRYSFTEATQICAEANGYSTKWEELILLVLPTPKPAHRL
jgi:hypothetical protein